jgi:hypothetical protein
MHLNTPSSILIEVKFIEMHRNYLKSSTLHSAGYDRDHKTLELKFNSGEIYQYLNVPHSNYTGLMNATSHGEYFNRYIKEQFLFIKVI